MLVATEDNPTLLTAEEAAAIARCSIKTVRRAYGAGALVAYRRRGSRAVLLDKRDVLDWAQGEAMETVSGDSRQFTRASNQAENRGQAKPADDRPRSQYTNDQTRFDVSSSALRARRRARAE